MGIWASLRSGARRAGAELRKLPRHFDAWRLLALFTCLGVIAILTGAWRAHLTQDKWLDDLWLEVAKAGVQVVAVGVLGGALAAVWRNITAQREAKVAEDAKERDREIERSAKERDQEIERNDKIRAELVSLVALYNGVKSVRRIVRSLGLDLKTYPEAERETAGQTAILSEEQARGFHSQMLILNGLQLEFESKARQFGQTNFLGDDTDQVVTNLGRIENHLNRVLELWEKSGWTIQQGTPLRLVSDGLKLLLRVREHLRPEVSDPLRKITELINKYVFGEALKETQDALAKIVSKQEKREREEEEDGER
jgi:hypothetical protein